MDIGVRDLRNRTAGAGGASDSFLLVPPEQQCEPGRANIRQHGIS
jgi:hypothetical protein